MYPYNHKMGQTIQTDVDGARVDRSFLAHFAIAAGDAVADATADGIHAAMPLGAQTQTVTTGFTNPNVPRNVTVKGNVSGINKKVKIYGTNWAGEAITEEITPNGTNVVPGTKAFATVTKIDLPTQNHAPVQQVETATAAGTVVTAGNAKVVVTSSLFDEPITLAVPVELGDEANDIAEAIRAALAANDDITEHYTVGGTNASVVLTAKVAAANDDTLNIAISDGDGEGASSGVTTAATSTTNPSGVPADTLSLGFGDVFGLPYKLTADELVIVKLFNNAVDAGTVAVDPDYIEKNTFDPAGVIDGQKPIDLYIIV